MTTASNLKLGSSLSQESLAAVQKKEYVWDYKGNPYNIEIKEFLGLNYARFNSASYETN